MSGHLLSRSGIPALAPDCKGHFTPNGEGVIPVRLVGKGQEMLR